MKKNSQPIELTPVKREVLSPAEFLRLSKDRPHSIARSRFVAPKFGSKGFGGFVGGWGASAIWRSQKPDED